MNREIRNRVKIIRDSLREFAEEMDEWFKEKEPTPEEIDELIAETVEDSPVNWTTADEPAKEGLYLKDLNELTKLKGLAITGQIKATTDLKTYKKKDGSGIGLIYNVLLSDPTGDMLCVFWNEQVEDAKKFTIGQYIRISNFADITKFKHIRMNKMDKLELHPGKFAKIEVVE